MRLISRIQRVYFCLGLFLIPAPVFLLAGAAMGTGAAALVPLLAALLLSAGILRLKNRFRLPAVALSVVLCFFLALLTGKGAETGVQVYAAAALAALAAAIYPRFLGGILAGGSSPVLWYSGLVTAGVCWAAGRLMGLPQAGGMMSLFTWVYAVYLVFALMLESLREAAGAGRTPSGPMLLKNAGAALVWTGLFLLLTHLPAAARALRALWNAVRDGAAWLFSLLGGLFPDGQSAGGGGGGGGMMFPAVEEQPPSPLWLFLEKVFRVVCVILLALAAAGLLYLLGKALLRMFRALAARFRAYMNAVNTGYDDQVESLLDWGEIRRGIRQRRQREKKTRPERVRWDRLTPRQQVRRSYQAYLRRHPEIPDSRTARQALPDSSHADIYDAARYSSRDITPQEAAAVMDLRNS